MSLHTSPTIYVCPDSVRWVKDTDRIIIVDEQRGKTYILQGVDVAIWSWLTLKYSYQKLIRLLSASLVISPSDAEQTILNTLHKWHTQGLLETVKEIPRGQYRNSECL